MELRPYQDEAIGRVDEAEQRGVRRLLGVAATGLGKTVMFGALIHRREGRALVLVHRDELVNQAVTKLAEQEPTMPISGWAYDSILAEGRSDLVTVERPIAYTPEAIGVVKAEADDVGCQVIVASVQTLARERRLDRLLRGAAEPFSIVVVDEAHHAAADSYRAVLAGLRAGEADGPLLFGVTATPERGDGAGLDDLFDEVVFNYDIMWGIRAGYLSDLRCRQVVLADFDESKLKVRAGDYTAGSAGRALTDADAAVNIVAAWKREAEGRRTLVFTPTVQVAQDVAQAFQWAGVSAGWVSGETPLEERRDLLRRFAEGDITVLANCQVLTEGYDAPFVDCVVVARPTKSQSFYVQMVGRGTRRHPGKDDCLVLDVVGAADHHSLITVPTLFGLGADDAVRTGEKPISVGVADHEQELVHAGLLAARDAELFKRINTSQVAWVRCTDPKTGSPAFVRTLGAVKVKGQMTYLPTVWLIRRPDSDEWLCGLTWRGGAKKVLIDHQPLEVVQGVGEDYVRKAPSAARFAQRDGKWRDRPATDKQREFAGRWKLTIPDGMTAGEASDLIDVAVARAEAVRSR